VNIRNEKDLERALDRVVSEVLEGRARFRDTLREGTWVEVERASGDLQLVKLSPGTFRYLSQRLGLAGASDLPSELPKESTAETRQRAAPTHGAWMLVVANALFSAKRTERVEEAVADLRLEMIKAHDEGTSAKIAWTWVRGWCSLIQAAHVWDALRFLWKVYAVFKGAT
jgi:hypothetical protein